MLILVGDGVGAIVESVGADDTEGADERVGASDGTAESEGADEQKYVYTFGWKKRKPRCEYHSEQYEASGGD